MYRYNILNSCVACLELQDVVEKTISGLLVSKQNIDDVKNEALELLKSDEILEKYSKPLQISLIKAVSSKTGKKKTNESNESIRKDDFLISLYRLKYQLATLCDKLKQNYCIYVVQELKEALDNQDKLLIERYSSILISQCIYEGWSPKGLFYLYHILEGNDNSLEGKIELFFNTITSNLKTNFEVIANIKLDNRRGSNLEFINDTINSLGINLKKGSDIIHADGNPQSLNNFISPDKYYTIIDVEAFDAYSAVLTAINNLQSKISVASFYNLISPFLGDISTIYAFNKNTQQAITLELKDVFQTYDHIDSSSVVFEATKRLLNDPDQNKAVICDKLKSVFSYTNLSKSSYFQETKFITLWIALESIMKTGHFTDIITHIKHILPPSLCVRYFYSIARNFAEDCKRCRINLIRDPLNLDLYNDNKRDLAKKVIFILRDETLYPILLEKCSPNDLLYYRCKQLHTIFNDCQTMLNKLLHYKKKVEWHVQRLYR